jgi:hypothetical protein
MPRLERKCHTTFAFAPPSQHNHLRCRSSAKLNSTQAQKLSSPDWIERRSSRITIHFMSRSHIPRNAVPFRARCTVDPADPALVLPSPASIRSQLSGWTLLPIPSERYPITRLVRQGSDPNRRALLASCPLFVRDWSGPVL